MAQVKYPAQQMHRIAYTKLTETDNGPTLDYRFAGKDRLTVSENGGTGSQAGYGALTLVRNGETWKIQTLALRG